MAKELLGDTLNYLADVPPEFVFWSCDGSIFRNMRDLRDGLANMTEETYACHVNADKNDFSRWVLDIIKDGKLATELQRTTSKVEAAQRVGTRIARLSRK